MDGSAASGGGCKTSSAGRDFGEIASGMGGVTARRSAMVERWIDGMDSSASYSGRAVTSVWLVRGARRRNGSMCVRGNSKSKTGDGARWICRWREEADCGNPARTT